MKIKKIDEDDLNLLTAQKYTQDIVTIIKELIENSLDAESKNIKIFLESDKVVVEDDGIGIEDLSLIGNKGVTGKFNLSVKVASQCSNDKINVLRNDEIDGNMSEENDNKKNSRKKINIIKDVDNKSSFLGYRGMALFSIKEISDLEIISKHKNSKFALKQNFKEEIKKVSREQGTTIIIKNIFKNCPIRKKLQKNYKKRIDDLLKIMRSYLIIYEISFTFFCDKKLIFSSKSNGTLNFLKKNYPKYFNNYFYEENEIYKFYLSKNNIKSNEYIFLYLENRPINADKIVKSIINTFNIFKKDYPFLILILKCNADINLSVDKKEIRIFNEDFIIKKLKNFIEREMSQSINNDVLYSDNFIYKVEKGPSSFLKYSLPTNLEIMNILSEKDVNKTKRTKKNDIKEKKILDENDDVFYDNINKNVNIEHKKSIKNNLCIDLNPNKYKLNSLEHEKSPDLYDKSKNTMKNLLLNQLENIRSPFKNKNKFNLLSDSQIISQIEFSSDISPLNSDLFYDPTNENKIDEIILKKQNHVEIKEKNKSYKIEFEIQKPDFKDMKIIGQFNNGFILTILEKQSKKYLIIIDQHAADEIKNFEILKSEFYLKKQKLIIPKKLELNPIDEYIVKANLKMISRNGFEIDENLNLRTVPVYKNEIFSINDLMELIELLRNDKNSICNKFRNIMASKACRSSIMIGDPLNYKEMENVVYSLSELKIPWNCPHGRPVFKILYEI